MSEFDPKNLNFTQEKLVKERSQIVALSIANISRKEISIFTGRHISTITRYIKKTEQCETLVDRPRSGRPVSFTEQIQLKITAFFCQFNPLPGCNSISLNWASNYFEQNPSFLGCSISASSIGRILRKHSLKPHLHKYFLQITDPNFFDIMPSIIDLYLNPPEFLFCFDECPGIQALNKLAPPLPPGNGKKGIKYSEPNHNRKGTIDLYSFFDVNSGKVFGECTANHQVETLIQVFRKHVAGLPNTAAQIHYICDNLGNHSCHDFCRVVAELSGVDYPEKELDSKEKRQKWLQQENKRIVIHFTPKHGSWLNMVEIWFGILGQKCLKYNSSKYIDELIDFINDFIATWNQHFAHPFNWTYDGKGLHRQAVKRFTKHIVIENKFMEIGFLSNQIELMLNIFQGHFNQVDKKYWRLLLNAIVDKQK
jgi:transposase